MSMPVHTRCTIVFQNDDDILKILSLRCQELSTEEECASERESLGEELSSLTKL
jgi:hypothetical protein